MSRWWPDRLVVRVGDEPLPAGGVATGGPAASVDRWDAVVDRLERALDTGAAKRGTRITCVVAGNGVRYRVVPWSDELASPARRQALAVACFKEAYGEVASGWAVRHAPCRYGAPTLACAIDASLIDRIDAIARSRGMRLASVQPSLMSAFDGLASDAGAAHGAFVCIEPTSATLLLTASGEPVHVKQLPSAGFDLSLALDRQWFALGLEGVRPTARVATFVGGEGGSAWRHFSAGQPVAEALA